MPKHVTMPALSAGMTDATLTRWVVAEGATINIGDILAEVETDKATLEIEAEVAGIFHRALVAAGGTGLSAGSPIATILLPGEDPATADQAPSPTTAPTAATEPAALPDPAGPGDRPATSVPGAERIFASPLARVIARDSGIDLHGLSGSGPRGRIRKLDVLDALGARDGASPAAITAAPAPASAPHPAPTDSATADPARTGPRPMPWQSFTAEKTSSMRRTIARRLSEAKRTVPHFYLKSSADLDRLIALRAELNDSLAGRAKVSINDCIIKAAAIALADFPAANAMWTPDEILTFDDVDISVAVSTDGGLITPVIRQADRKGLTTIATEMRALAEAARAGRLRPEEYQGGGFSISNLGMFGVEEFAAIINPPQSCILAVGAALPRIVPHEGQAALRHVATLTLSVDHRSVDGALGAQLLGRIRHLLENPMAILG